MGQGHRRAAVLVGAAVVLVGVLMFLVPDSSDWRTAVAIAVVLAFLIGVAALIAQDAAARGRSGWKWLTACALVPPLGLPAFAVVAVYDRLRGRTGIEARWDRAGRWYLLGGLILTVASAGLAVSQVTVQSTSVSAPGVSGYYSGSCSSALSVFLGAGPYSDPPYWSADTAPTLAAARSTVAGACSAAATDRMSMSAICLGGALLLALAGTGMNRHQRRRTLALP
jgi:hypothetical protein